MRSSVTACPALVVLLVAIVAIDGCYGSATLTYDPALAALMPNLDLGDGTVTSPLDLIRATAPDLSDVNFHLSPFIVPAAVTASKNFTTKPIAVTSMCLASSVGNSTGLTLAQIGAALLGSPSPTTTNIRWYLAPPSVSPSSASLLQALVLNSITSFTSNTAWPAAVLSNAKVQMLADDATISAVVNNCPPSMWCVGPQLGYASWAAPIQCLRIRRTVNVTGDTVSYSSRLTASTTPYISVAPQYGTAYATGPVYPFIGGVYLSARKGVPCDVIDALTDMLTAFFTNTSNAAALESSGFQAVTTIVGFATLSLIVPYSGTNCTNKLLTAAISGDANLYDAAATLNFDAYGDALNMVSFSTKLTSAALTEVYAVGSTRHAALVEAVPNATLKATKPSIVAAPVFAHGVALIYTLDGRDGLVASLCTMLGMLNGTIQYWDNPALKADNVGIQLPHLKITRIMAFDGSQEAAGRGVSYIARRCGLTLKTSYTSYPFATDVPAVWYNIVSQVQNTEGAIGLSTLSSAIAASMNQLAILFPSQLQVSGTQDDIAAVIAQSSLNTTTNAFKFPARTVDYFPFVSVVYAVIDTDASGGCEAYSRVLDWLMYVVGSRSQSVLVFGNQAVLSDSMRAVAASAIQRTMCDGVVLYPVPVEPLVWWPYAVIVAVVVAFIASIVGRAGYRHWVLSVRPMDPTKAIAVMFVGIKNQAAVLEAGEENAAAVHTRVAETVRALVRKHGCYEARRIDSATTMIVAKDATRAVACAEDIVLTLSVDVPWLETVMTHPMPQAKKYDIRGEMRRSETGSRTSGDLNTGRKSNHTPRTPVAATKVNSQPTSARRDAVLQQLSAARHSPSTSPRGTPTPPGTPPSKRISYIRNTSNPALRRVTSQLESPHNAPSKIPSSMDGKTQHTSTSHTGLTLQQCVPEVYAGVHWTHVMVDVQDDAVSYRGAGINTAACIADLAVGGQVIVSREFMDCLNVDLGDDDGGYHFATVGDGKSSDELVGMSLTTERFPEWLIARSALRRKSLEEKDNSDGNMIAAAMASADGALARRRIAVVSMLVRDLLREGADGRAPVIGETLAELLDIVTSNRGQIHSITDGVVTVTVGAGAPVAMAAVRAAQIAMEATELCVAIGVNSGSALVGNAMGGKAATVGRVVAGAALMRVAAARAAVPICATDVAKADLAAKFELATVDLIAAPWDRTKHVRCFAIVEERAQAEEGEWLYDMNDGFAPLEQRFDWHAMRQTCDGAPPVNIHSAFLCRQEPIISLSDDLYMALQQATEGAYVHDFYLSRLHTLGSFGFSSGCSVVV